MIPDENPKKKKMIGSQPTKLPFYDGSFIKNWIVV
jgi:hypothetical protein